MGLAIGWVGNRIPIEKKELLIVAVSIYIYIVILFPHSIKVTFVSNSTEISIDIPKDSHKKYRMSIFGMLRKIPSSQELCLNEFLDVQGRLTWHFTSFGKGRSDANSGPEEILTFIPVSFGASLSLISPAFFFGKAPLSTVCWTEVQKTSPHCACSTLM